MLRSIGFKFRTEFSRGFRLGSVLGKSRKKDADSVGEASINIVDLKMYLKDADTKFNETLKILKNKFAQKKVGSYNPSIFDKLEVGNEKLKFTDVATTSLKGRNSLLVTVFDPKATKKVISAILGSGLNMNPEHIPGNEQQLKVALPPVTVETRQEMCKEIKKIFEEYKNSGNRHSLGYIRGEVLKKLKKLQKKDDTVKNTIQDIEKLHKEYLGKLQEQLNHSQKSIMN